MRSQGFAACRIPFVMAFEFVVRAFPARIGGILGLRCLDGLVISRLLIPFGFLFLKGPGALAWSWRHRDEGRTREILMGPLTSRLDPSGASRAASLQEGHGLTL